MRLLSEEYLHVLLETKRLYPNWGSTAHTKAEYLDSLLDNIDESILDYGAGTGSLSAELPIHNITEYDPLEYLLTTPIGTFDHVVSIDVMEHVEPEYLQAVLKYQQQVADKSIVHYISTRPAVKILSDGRNAHLIVEPVDWWERKLDEAYSPAFKRGDTVVCGGSFWITYQREREC